jgi:hypothetical protein
MPAKLEGQKDPLPSVGTIMPISRGSVLEFETKKERKHYFREVRNIYVVGRVEKTRWSHIPITFSEEDVRLHGFPHNDALVIEANITSWTLGKLLVDNGSSADIIFADAFNKMGLSKDLLQPPDTLLYGFGGRVIHALGKVVLPVSLGTVQNARTEYLSFDTVEMYYPYNDILGRGFLNKFEAVIHQAYLCVKIPSTRGSSQFVVTRTTVAIWKEAAAQGKEMFTPLAKQSRAERWKNSRKQTEKKSTYSEIVTPRGSYLTQWLWIRPSLKDRLGDLRGGRGVNGSR